MSEPDRDAISAPEVTRPGDAGGESALLEWSLADVATLPLPRASFSQGVTGLAFFWAERARLASSNDAQARAVAVARHLVALAAEASTLPGAFAFAPAKGVPVLAPAELAAGVFTGLAGLGYVELLVGAVAGDEATKQRGRERLRAAFRAHLALPAPSHELYMGTAGYVAACTDLGARGLGDEALQAIERQAVDRLRARPEGEGEAGRPAYLGGAHGEAGMLLAELLSAREDDHVRLRTRLDALLAQAHLDDDYIAWPSARGGEVPAPMWGSFCNGVVAQTVVYARAFALLGEPRYRDAARAGAFTCHALGGANVSVCCGFGGVVTALSYAGRVLADAEIAGWARDDLRELGALPRNHRAPHDLLQGQLGADWLQTLEAGSEALFFPLLRGLQNDVAQQEKATRHIPTTL